MKHILITLVAILGFTPPGAFAQEDGGSLPFAVSLGGKAATHTKGEAFAKITDAVASDASIEVGSKAEMIILNVHKAKANGTSDEASAGAIIILQGTNKGSLDKTMDKQKLAAGKYFLSVVADGKTASIQFSIK